MGMNDELDECPVCGGPKFRESVVCSRRPCGEELHKTMRLHNEIINYCKETKKH